MPERPELSAFKAHVVAQTRSNVEFLMSQGMIERNDGHSFLAKLPTEDDPALRDLLEQTRRMTIPSPSLSQPSIDYPPPPGPPPSASGPPARVNVPPAQPNVQRAKALWSYNENGLEPNDLSFRTGDIIEIVAQTNGDWWTGKINGKQGPFPSSYVEKIPSSASPPSYPPPRDTRTASSPKPYQSGPTAAYEPVYNGSPQGGYPSQPPRSYSPYQPPSSQPLPQQVAARQASPPANFSRYGSSAPYAVSGSSFVAAGQAAGSESNMNGVF